MRVREGEFAGAKERERESVRVREIVQVREREGECAGEREREGVWVRERVCG